jgi:hypothetical protein
LNRLWGTFARGNGCGLKQWAMMNLKGQRPCWLCTLTHNRTGRYTVL